jgi:hypothetical protein
MKRTALLFLLVFLFAGCAALERHPDGREVTPENASQHPVDQAITGVATALNPVTGGISGGLGVAAIAAIGLYRRSKRQQAILDEIDENPDTPPAAQQVRSKGLRRAASTMTDIDVGVSTTPSGAPG